MREDVKSVQGMEWFRESFKVAVELFNSIKILAAASILLVTGVFVAAADNPISLVRETTIDGELVCMVGCLALFAAIMLMSVIGGAEWIRSVFWFDTLPIEVCSGEDMQLPRTWVDLFVDMAIVIGYSLYGISIIVLTLLFSPVIIGGLPSIVICAYVGGALGFAESARGSSSMGMVSTVLCGCLIGVAFGLVQWLFVAFGSLCFREPLGEQPPI